MIGKALANKLAEAATSTGFGKAIDVLLAHALECAYVINSDPGDGTSIGQSRMGGAPDLPEHASWPGGRKEDGSSVRADFLAQVKLADVSAIQGVSLPRQGLVSLFVQSLPVMGPPRVTALYNPFLEGFQRRGMPADEDWAVGDLTRWETVLQFVPGVSLPFGRTAFREALYDVAGPASWNELSFALEPSGCVGRVGGFAYSFEGHDLIRDMVLIHHGHRDWIVPDQYDSIEELEYSSRRQPPSYVRTEEELADWRRSYETLRPQAEWIGRHRAEVAAWRLLFQFTPNVDAGFSLGDSYPLWIFARDSELAAGDFTRLEAQCVP